MADAYKRTSWTDWVGPLYKKVVIGGHFHYLSDYKTAFPLKANMFQELASRSVRTNIIIRLVYIHTVTVTVLVVSWQLFSHYRLQ